MSDLHAVRGKGEQPFRGEGLQHGVHITGTRALPFGKFRSRDAVGGVHAVIGRRDQPQEDPPGRALLAGGKALIGALRAARHRSLNAACPFVVRQGEGIASPAAPRLVKGVRQQRQHTCARDAAPAAHLGQQDFDEIVRDDGACLLGRLGNGQPQLQVGHGHYEVAALDSIDQLRVVGAPGFEVGAYSQHHQGRRRFADCGPGSGGGMQGRDEGQPLAFVRTLGEQLLELVNHEQHPQRGPRISDGRVSRQVWCSRPGGLPGDDGETGRVGSQFLP
jgi:hypothetical protein